MKIIRIDRNVVSGQCKGALLRVQYKLTAVFLFSDLPYSIVGSQLGFFTPGAYEDGQYKYNMFYFHPWLAPDIAVCSLPKWYRALARLFRFRFKLGA